MRVLRTAADVDAQVRELIAETLDWFDGEPLRTEAFIDRLADAGNHAAPPFDIESYHNPATRKIMRLARELRRGA